jgi:D-glycero-alpha-D-manno-heptose 1-phosphate guanylyltransferase
MLETALILAGGFGTRLQSVVTDVPKPMANVASKPFLYYQLKYLSHYKLKNVILCTGHLAHKVEEYFGDHFEDLRIVYSCETNPLGTGGAIKEGLSKTHSPEILVLNGDSFFEADLAKFYLLHEKSGRPVSLALREVSNPSRYGRVVTDATNLITEFGEKTSSAEKGLINAGVYLLDRETFILNTPQEKNFSIEKDFFETRCSTVPMNGFEMQGYFIDIGIPADYEKAQNDFKGFKY